MKRETWDIIAQWIDAEDPVEQAAFEEELVGRGISVEELEEIRRTYQTPAPSGQVKVNLDAEWLRFRETVDTEVEQAPIQRKSRRNLVYGLVAATLAMVAVFFAIDWSDAPPPLSQTQTKNDISRLVFADGTEVILYRNSTLGHPNHFGSKERKVTLSGEAFFAIQKEEERPFKIETELGEVEVLGTRFLLSCRPQSEQLSINMREGKVLFTTANGIQKEVRAGERLTYLPRTQALGSNNEQNPNDFALVDQKLTFNNTPLPTVIADVEYYFGIQIENEVPGSETCHYSGTFEKPELTGVLDLLTASLDVNFTKVEKGRWRMEGPSCE